jgi:hypothetical protein
MVQLHHADAIPPQHHYPGSKAMLSLSGQWVTTAYQQRIQEAVTRPAHQQWFLRRFPHMSTDQYQSIDWRGIGLARRRKRHRHTSRITKLMAGWLNVGHQKIKMHKDGRCPCCRADDETQLHLFKCAQPDMVRTRTAALVSLAAHLQECGVPQQIH